MAVFPREQHEYTPPSVLTRTLDLSRLNIELIAFVGLVLLSVLAHLYGLGRMALHHDESIHAWMSWKFFTGSGGFTCFEGRTANTYCYEPTYHGPALYILTLFSYFLFGDGDWQARLPQAMAGIGMVASVWMLRPYLGTRGMFIAATLLAFAPSLLYYTRFARHDGLILLWTLWIVIGFFRYLDTGRPAFLYLMAAGTALAIATHELYYILFFIFGCFLLIRVAFELLPRRQVVIALAVLLGASCVIELWNPQITPTLRAGGMALLFITTAATGLLMTRVWDETPVVVVRAKQLWREQRGVVWTALTILATIYVLMYSTFFADPRGIIDGLYAGLKYWLGSQQDAARGDQPWYYHLMLLSIYEPLALFGSIAAAVYLFSQGWARGSRGWRMQARSAVDEANDPTSENEAENGEEPASAHTIDGDDQVQKDETPQAPASVPPVIIALFPLFLVFWFFGSLVAFSWAGEKMPWLVTHISLPGNLLIAWALGRVLDSIRWKELPDRRVGLVPPFFALMLIALGVAYWRFSTPPDGQQQGQSYLLQGLIPLVIGGVLLYIILTLAQRNGWKPTLGLAGLTIAALMGAYMIRATWMVVYDHPDTPIEPLVYVQSSPDVPLIVEHIHELAVNQTRNIRTDNDPTGGLTMPVIMDNGDTERDGEGSLAWPFQWYLRDYKRLENRSASFFREATPESFIVDPVQPGADRELAPIVLVSKSDMNETTRGALDVNYVKLYDSKLNWWFPEGNKCDPASPGYKRFYYSSWMMADALKDCPDIDRSQVSNVFGPLLWPLDGSHWGDTWQYMLYRKLPDPLRLDGREMEVWVRRDLAARPVDGGGGVASGPYKLVSQQVFGSTGSGDGQMNLPSSLAVDPQGNVYIADTNNHRIQVFDANGAFVRSIGSYGSGDGQFNEPRGVAIDQQGNIFVADTWNARVVKLDPSGAFVTAWGEGKEDFGSGRRATTTDGTAAGNTAEPLGFFGPRGIAVDDQGNVYLADTGNKRVVVTDSDGNFLYQWGYFGAEAGAFSEPIGIAVDETGTVYVADTWNARVQAFVREANGQVNPTPIATWRVAGWQPQTYDDPFITAANGQVVVSVPGRNAVALTDTTGQELLRWGGTGDDLASMKLPSGVAFAPDGTVYVVDRGNTRIMQFKLPVITR